MTLQVLLVQIRAFLFYILHSIFLFFGEITILVYTFMGYSQCSLHFSNNQFSPCYFQFAVNFILVDNPLMKNVEIARKWQVDTLETYMVIKKTVIVYEWKTKMKNTKINFFLNKHLVHLFGRWKNDQTDFNQK